MGNLKHRRLRGRVIAVAIRALNFVTRNLPLPVVRAWGVAIGHLGWHVLGRYRARALNNIAIAFPGWTNRQRKATVRKMFHALATHGINIAMINTSEVSINVVVDRAKGQEALEALKSAFHL